MVALVIGISRFVLGAAGFEGVAGAAGVAGTFIGGGALVAGCDTARLSSEPVREAYVLSTDNVSARPKKMPADHLVICVSVLPEPAPKSASVVLPPNASPAPASFFGS